MDVAIETRGAPHRGSVLAVVTPHLDDGLFFAGGTIAKLLAEGYEGYLIRVSNDEMCSLDLTPGETVAAAERDAARVCAEFGLHPPIELGYRNHEVDGVGGLILRARLIYLFRVLRVDTVLTYDPSADYEENPDHRVVSRAVEAACWMAGYPKEYPEHALAGILPHAVSDRYYFARGPQLSNLAVDTTDFVSKKLSAICAAETAMRQLVQEMRAYLNRHGLELPWIAAEDKQAVREYAERQTLSHDRRVGARFGLGAAELFHYLVKDDAFTLMADNDLSDEIRSLETT
jgi:LmbE family N-acetylglucosaminyl deacetylase